MINIQDVEDDLCLSNDSNDGTRLYESRMDGLHVFTFKGPYNFRNPKPVAHHIIRFTVETVDDTEHGTLSMV